MSCDAQLVSFPAHALLILEERLKEQEAEGVQLPAGTSRTELALLILVTAARYSRSRHPRLADTN